MRRGQLSLSLVEAGVGVMLVFAVVAGAAVGVPDPGTEQTALDRYARDALTVLRAGGDPTLDEAISSGDAFREHRDGLRERLDGLLPPGVRYRVETPHGAVGHPVPRSRAVGTATASTRHGSVTVEVWYA